MLSLLWRITKKLGRIVKKTLMILFVLFLVLAIALTIFLLTFDLNHYKRLAEQKLTLLLRHPVTIEAMHTKLAVVPTITINNFQIANNDPFQDKSPLLFIKEMNAELELIPLIHSKITIHKINIDEAQLNLYKTEQQDNWSIGAPQASTPETSEVKNPSNIYATLSQNLRIDEIVVKTLNASYEGARQQQKLTIQNIKIGQFHTLDAAIEYKNQKFNISANTGLLFQLLGKQPNFPVDIKIKSKLGNINLNGKIGNLVKFSDIQATASLKTNDLKELLNFSGIKHELLPAKPADLQLQVSGDLDKMDIKKFLFQLDSGNIFSLSTTGKGSQLLKNPSLNLKLETKLASPYGTNAWQLQPFTLEGDFLLSLDQIKTSKAILDANRSDAIISLDLQKEKENSYKAIMTMKSDFFDPYDFIEITKNPVSKQETSAGTPTSEAQDTPLPWDILQKIHGSLTLNINHLQAGNWLTGHIGVSTQSTLTNGQLKAPVKLTLLNGQLNGELSAQVPQQSIKLSAQASNLNLNGLRPLQQDLQDVILDAKINLNSKGKTLSALIQNLNGKVILQASQGQIVNKWLTNLPKMLNLGKKTQKVAFSNTDNLLMIDCAAANLSIQNGVVTGQDRLALETNSFDILAGGTVNLNKKTMNVVLQPTLADIDMANEVLSFSKFVRISGPFNSLEPKVDTQKAATNLIQKGVNQLMGMSEQKTSKQKYAMCQKILGKEALTQFKSTTIVQTAKPAPSSQKGTADTKQTKRQKFQEQLLNTLLETLSTP